MSMKPVAVLLALLSGVGLAQECQAGFRLFEHEYLATAPVCIPENPQRVLALEMGGAEMTLFAGRDLVGSGNWVLNELPVLLPELADRLGGVQSVGYPANLETVLLSDPDVILATEDAIDVAAASEIAPVVVASPEIYDDWHVGAEFWSAVLGAPELYEQMAEAYDARIAALRQALGERRSELEVSLIGASTYGAYLWLSDTAPGSVLSDVGLARPGPQALDTEAAAERYSATQYVPISDEQLDLADGDVIFVFSYAARNPETRAKESAFLEAFKQKPLWQSLGAVEAGKVYYVGGHWWRAYTYLLANKVLDDLFTNLTSADPKTVPNPLQFSARMDGR